MSAAAELLREVHSLGIQLQPDGERIRYRAPGGVFTADLRLRLQAHRDEVLEELRRQTPEPAAQEPGDSILAAGNCITAQKQRPSSWWPSGGLQPATPGSDDSLMAPGERLIAVRIRCPYGDAWLVPNDQAAELLVAERRKDATEPPIFTYAEIEVLRTKSPRVLRALFVAKAALPGSRLLQ